MRIGVDVRAIGKKRTGDETYTLGLVRGLLEFGKQHEYFFYVDTDKKEEIEKIKEKLGVTSQNYSIVSVTPAKKIIWTFFLLPIQAKKNKLDILHVQYITPQIIGKKISLITTIHDISFERYPQYINKKDLFFLKKLIPLSLKKANGVIAVSEFTKREIVDKYKIDQRKIVGINNGCEAERFGNKISDDSLTELKNKYNLKKPFVFYVGTLQPRKNIPFLIKGFVELKKRYSKNDKIREAQLIVGGSLHGKNYDIEIDKELKKLEGTEIKDDIRFVEYIEDEDLSEFYRLAQVYLNASLYEGFGLPLVEAMASRTPVVCSDSSCYPEIVGDAAGIFENNDIDSFSKILFEVLTDESRAEELIEKGIERSKMYSWKKTAMQTLKFYDIIYSKKMRH